MVRLALIALLVAACTGDDDVTPTPDGPGATPTIAFDVASDLTDKTFWDFPYPSDLRLTADGHPDLAGFPNSADIKIVDDLRGLAELRAGFPVMPTAYFRFIDAAPAHAVDAILADDAALLLDIDATSPEQGTTYPLVAQTLPVDRYAPKTLVAVAPRPGIVLRGHTKYAVVLRQAFAPGVAAPAAFTALATDTTSPAGALYAPLWPALAARSIDDAIAATVFTTGDEVETLRTRSEAIRTTQHAVIADLHVDPGTPATRDGFCALAGTVTFPQYQTGSPPFDGTGGTFVLDANGVPIPQSTMTVPLRITLPTREMPAAGWPLWQYFHGSGGASFDIVDEGPTPAVGAPTTPGEGPGKVVAQYGIAAAASALPLNPERLPGAASTAYLNLSNLAAFPHTFQQGVFEQRLLLDALVELQIDPSAVCANVTLPTGATKHFFNAATLTAGGHSMGGMYTNMIGAVEPRYGALTPFGAGGFWPMMILQTQIVESAPVLLGGILDIDPTTMQFTHPVLSLLGTGWEIAEPGAAMAHIQARPLAGMPRRHIYQPIGLDDIYFPNPVFDAAALAYGTQQAGATVWPGTQQALALAHLDGTLAYPVHGNRPGAITAVAVQYADDGIVDSHQIFRQLDAVKAQYGCFLSTYLATGTPTVIAPDATCP